MSGNLNIPVITCARCKRPVDEISWMDDISTIEQERIFRVLCHGQYEVTRLSKDILIHATEIEGGVAFATNRLEDHA